MSEEVKPTAETVVLPTGGSIPGIPGSHGPGRYFIDWIARTLTPVVDIVEEEIAHLEEASHIEPAQPALAEPSTEPVTVPEQAPDETAGATAN